MKKLGIAFAMLWLAGCRLDGDSLLGNNPENRSSTVMESYNVCREKKVVEEGTENAAGCATPVKLEDILYKFEGAEDGILHVSFVKLWDGTYPKIHRLVFEATSSSSSTPRTKELACKIIEGAAETRTYECRLTRRPVEYNESYAFERLDLQNEKCPAKASFKAVFHDPVCRESYYGFSPEVWFNHSKWPTLYPIEEPTTPAPPRP